VEEDVRERRARRADLPHEARPGGRVPADLADLAARERRPFREHRGRHDDLADVVERRAV